MYIKERKRNNNNELTFQNYTVHTVRLILPFKGIRFVDLRARTNSASKASSSPVPSAFGWPAWTETRVGRQSIACRTGHLALIGLFCRNVVKDQRVLVKKGITKRFHAKVVEVEERILRLEQGMKVPFSYCVWATGRDVMIWHIPYNNMG
jgi:hypothetical protein